MAGDAGRQVSPVGSGRKPPLRRRNPQLTRGAGLRRILLAAALLHNAHAVAQEAGAAAPRMLDPVVVSATRSEQSGFDLPLSIDRIGGEAIRDGNPMINLSESLARVPGVVAQNRQNYAQDLQISSRGFGARSTFGVRGVRLYADGIPATMPDGQGQTSNFDLASADRIEVLRGPFSALYGNSSGGVISVFTEEGGPGQAISPYARFGSYGTSMAGLKASGRQGMANFVLNASRFDTDGYRQHSAASRDTANARLRLVPDTDTSLTLVGNAVAMRDVQDPLGLSRAQWQADPRGVDPNALLFNTRKSVSQQQAGMILDKTLDRDNSLQAMIYGGQRATVQYQAIPVAAQAAPTSAGGVIDLARRYGGIDLRWTRKTSAPSGNWRWTAGISVDTLEEDRLGFENFAGAALGVKGRLRRDEDNTVRSVDQYAQVQWEPDAHWLLLAGVRHSDVLVRSADRFIAAGNGDDSGSARYRAVTPVLGATWRLAPEINLYASYGKGFETPTLNELSYRSAPGAAAAAAAGGFNFSLRPAKSDNLEAGVKAFLSPNLRVNAALFHIDTKDELTVQSNVGGRSVFQNAGRTRRDGIELAAEGSWPNGLGLLLSWSLLRAVYADPFCPAACTAASRVPAGNRIPGVPASTAYAELSWRHRSGFSAAIEGRHAGRIQADDLNSDAAPGYVVANLRLGFEHRAGGWQVREFLRIDNLADRDYAGSVIVNEGNQRFFEPAQGRSFLAGVSAVYSW